MLLIQQLIVLMSNPLVNALSGIGNFFYRWSLRITKTAKHRLLTKRKNILLFGQLDHPLYQSLHSRLQPTWEITRIHTNSSKVDLPSATINSNPQLDKQGHFQSAQESKGSEQVKQIQKKSSNEPKQNFYRQYLLQDNYGELQKQLEGKQFDTIVVLPHAFTTTQVFNFEDQNLAVSYPSIHQNQILRNIFAYRLANRYLTTTGTFILSASERDFLKSQPEETLKNIKAITDGQWWPSVELIDAQCTYLGVVVGERDYTDLNSWGLVAMSREWIEEDLQFVAKHYAEWADGERLPMPGSFALFKRRTQNQKQSFIEYI